MTDKPISSMKVTDAANVTAHEELIKTPIPRDQMTLPMLRAVVELEDCMRANPDNPVSTGKLPKDLSLGLALAACKASGKPVGP